jgi:hypothetical protein
MATLTNEQNYCPIDPKIISRPNLEPARTRLVGNLTSYPPCSPEALDDTIGKRCARVNRKMGKAGFPGVFCDLAQKEEPERGGRL